MNQRLFLALWPDEEVRARLLKAAATPGHRLSGRGIERGNLHLTVVFLGSTDHARRACVERLVSSVEADSFTLVIDQLGYFPRTQVLWMGAANTPVELLSLVRSLNAGIPECGFTPERREFRPHITLARKVISGPRSPMAVEPIEWRVGNFCLVESITDRTGAQYRVLRIWPLKPPASPPLA